jgi:hypothetical protein
MSARLQVVELSGLVDAEERSGLIAWAEQRLAWPVEPGAPQLARCEVEEALLEGLVARLAGRLGRPLRLAGPAFLDRLDAGQRLPPTPGGGCHAGVSAMAVIVALNEGFRGGELVLYLFDAPSARVFPAGSAVAFPASMTCEELPVSAGRKYVLRLALAEGPG